MSTFKIKPSSPKRLGAKSRLRGKGQGVTEGVSSTKQVSKSHSVRDEARTDEAKNRSSKTPDERNEKRPKDRPGAKDGNSRTSHDGVKQGVPWTGAGPAAAKKKKEREDERVSTDRNRRSSSGGKTQDEEVVEGLGGKGDQKVGLREVVGERTGRKVEDGGSLVGGDSDSRSDGTGGRSDGKKGGKKTSKRESELVETEEREGRGKEGREKEKVEEGKDTVVRGEEKGQGYAPPLHKTPEMAEKQGANELKVVSPDQPYESTTMELSQRRAVPIFTDSGTQQTEVDRKKLKVLPGYACSTCTIGPECPEFKEGFVCAFNDAFGAFDTRDINGVIGLMTEVLDSNKERWRFGRIVEKIANSGLPDPNTTRLSEVVMTQAQSLVQLHQEMQKITIKTEVHGKTPSGSSAAPAVGILGRLFGGGLQLEPKKENELVPINIEDENSRAADKRDAALLIEHEAPLEVGRGSTRV